MSLIKSNFNKEDKNRATEGDGYSEKITLGEIQKIISRNKLTYLAYNNFRKRLFTELSPEDSEIILYYLPRLLSVNVPECPGYIKNPGFHFKVHSIEHHKEITRREPDFKKTFGINRRGRLIKSHIKFINIQGLYTIGSVGTVSQTSGSDCDIWVCIDINELNEAAWDCLNQKVNLIRDWLDTCLKIPVYFFISDVSAIKECRFGRVDEESSGSTQQYVLKEEFYRTGMVICGKIPLWWVAWDKKRNFSYDEALLATNTEHYWEYDIVDFGDIEKVEKNEYFGAALWQFHKSLYRPLKSIIKMLLLKNLLDSTEEKLLCHRFRELVLCRKKHDIFPDSSIYTMTRLLKSYQGTEKVNHDFLMGCLYIGCEINPYNRKHKLKNQLAGPFLKDFPITRERQTILRNFNSWKFGSQIEFGENLFKILLQIYGEISEDHHGAISESDKKDLTILGRKISSFYLKKRYKIPIIPKPTGKLNISSLTFVLNGDTWYLFSGNDMTSPVTSSKNIIYLISFAVWNNLFMDDAIHMRPNPTDITLKEIINLGMMIKTRFGTYDSQDIDYSNYIKEERIFKILIIAGLERSPWYHSTMDFGAVYINNWGEIFVRRFKSPNEFELFIQKSVKVSENIETGYYIRRNMTGYEKIIARTKRLLECESMPG